MLIGSCKESKPIDINTDKLISNIETLSDDVYEVRAFSRPGSKKAQEFIVNKFTSLGLQKIINNNYLEEFSHTFKGKNRHDVFPMVSPKPLDDYSNVRDTIATGANIIGMLKRQIKTL